MPRGIPWDELPRGVKKGGNDAPKPKKEEDLRPYVPEERNFEKDGLAIGRHVLGGVLVSLNVEFEGQILISLRHAH